MAKLFCHPESGSCVQTAYWKQPLALPWEPTAGSHARSPPKDDSMTPYAFSMTPYAFRARDLHYLVYWYRCNQEGDKYICYHCYRTISYVYNWQMLCIIIHADCVHICSRIYNRVSCLHVVEHELMLTHCTNLKM